MVFETSIGACNVPKIILISAITIAAAILLCSLKMSAPFIFYPQTPRIKLNNLLVTNFKVSDSNLVAIWLANITIHNPNIALSVHMNQIEASILYKHDYALSMTSVENFELDFMERRDVSVKFVTTGNEGDQPIIEYPLLKEIEKDWIQGKVNFQIRFNAMSKYEIDCPGFRGKSIMMNPFSMDLDVNVEDGRRQRRGRVGIYDIIGDTPKDGSWLIMIDE